MLRWTSAGAVSTPETLQVRVEAHHPDRLPAGAPTATRRLTPDELRANVHWFTEGLRGPRTRPCTTLVLSGHTVATRPDVPSLLDYGRELGIRRVVLHAGNAELAALDLSWMRGRVDTLVLPLHSPGEVLSLVSLARRAIDATLAVTFAIDLNRSVLPHLPSLVRQLDELRPAQIVVTWPFPTHEAPAERAPSPHTWAHPLAEALRQPRQNPLIVRGLPACHLVGIPAPIRRTTNRWYVDAEHQMENALLFLPSVVTFTKPDVCRFCVRDSDCDGFFQAYLDNGHPPLSPLSAPTPD